MTARTRTEEGRDPRQDASGCSGNARGSDISELSPAAGIRARDGGRSIQGTLLGALFDPLADCPTKARYKRAAEGARKGWASQAIKLKCLDCSGWTYREAKECEIRTCALWLLNRRIFKGERVAVEELNTPKEGEAA